MLQRVVCGQSPAEVALCTATVRRRSRCAVRRRWIRPRVLRGHGQGEPGGLARRWVRFRGPLSVPQITDLAAAGFAVYSPERVGHARTPDRDGPYSHYAMAEETSAFIEVVVGAPAHVVGWSDGMTVGLLTVMSRPELADRFVGIGSS